MLLGDGGGEVDCLTTAIENAGHALVKIPPETFVSMKMGHIFPFISPHSYVQ